MSEPKLLTDEELNYYRNGMGSVADTLLSHIAARAQRIAELEQALTIRGVRLDAVLGQVTELESQLAASRADIERLRNLVCRLEQEVARRFLTIRDLPLLPEPTGPDIPELL